MTTRDRLERFARLAMAALALGVLAGCAVSSRTGTAFDPTVLGRTLRPGVSTQADVRAALGEPFGKGSAMMPFQDRPHPTWTYFDERGTASTGSGTMDERLKFLFVFFDGNRLDSYLWFDSTLH